MVTKGLRDQKYYHNGIKWKCRKCDSIVMSVSVAYPIWDGPPGWCAGSGQCHYEDEPFCPKCEEKPSESGIPIQVNDKGDWG